jgi:hypothetical protein
MTGWILVALVGLAVAVALSVTASNLSTQPIGLSGDPLRAGTRLAPPAVTTPASVPKTAARAKPSTTTTHATTTDTTAAAPSSTAATPTARHAGTPVPRPLDGDDHGGHRDHDDD